jgi:hypothetical protein
MKRHYLFLIFLSGLIFFNFLSGCKSAAPQTPVEYKQPGEKVFWQVREDGLWFCAWEDPAVPLRIFLIRAELDKWEPVFSPPQEQNQEYLYSALTVSRFAAQNQTYAAVNGGPFQPYRIFSGQGMDPVGLVVWRGQRLSPARPGWSALVVLPDFTVSVCYQEEAPEEAVYALGGFQKLLTGAEINDLAESPHRPRTVLGLSEDGRILWLLVADGDRPGYSRGLTTRESAEWLQALGASEGMNLDGGGSSTLVLQDQGGLPGRAKPRLRLINRPSNRRTSNAGYSERLVASHLGLRPR